MTAPQQLPSQPPLQHHLSEELVFRYAAGMLDEAVSLIVASHLALCPSCNRLLMTAEALGGNLLEEAPGDTVSDDSWQRTLARLEAAPATRNDLRVAIKRDRAAQAGTANPLFPSPVWPYLKADIDKLPWRRLGPGIREFELVRSPTGSTARLLYIGAGGSVFEHSHKGTELTLTLQGSYQSNGQEFRRGDIEFADHETLHRPVAGLEADCICLAMTDAPLRFKSLLGRLFQPFIGI